MKYNKKIQRKDYNVETIETIKEMANYCLGCKAKPCSNGCPMKTNIPEFISKIKNEEFEEAYKILKANNIFSHICSIICPQEEQCEGSCIRGIKQKPTQIGKLERFINDWAQENSIKIEEKITEEKKKK